MITPKKMDILEDVLTNTDEGAFPGLAELSDLLTQPQRSAPQETRPAEDRQDTPPKRKRKVTHYLSPEISEGLDRNLPRIRKLVPEKARRKISKSRLVDLSVRLLLLEFEEKGKDSLLVRQFLDRERDGNGT